MLLTNVSDNFYKKLAVSFILKFENKAEIVCCCDLNKLMIKNV